MIFSLLSLAVSPVSDPVKQRRQRHCVFFTVSDRSLKFINVFAKQRQERQERRDIVINTHIGALNKDRAYTHMCTQNVAVSPVSADPERK